MTPAERILGRALAASTFDSREWGSVQAGLRDRAFFSARCDDARQLAAMREACAGVASGKLSESEARLAIREALARTGYAPPEGAAGGIRDLSSRARLDLVLRQNVSEAHGYARHRAMMDPDVLGAFPCLEFVRVQRRNVERTTWPARWEAAGGSFFGGRMVALKTDGVWTRLSRFGHPWPPFDFNSGMGVREVGRREAVRLGVIRAEDPPPKAPPLPDFNANLAERLPEGHERETDMFLRAVFGAQISIEDNWARWNAGLLRGMREGGGPDRAVLGQGRFNPRMLAAIGDEDVRKRVSRLGLTVTREWMLTHGAKHAAPKGVANLPLSTGDYEIIPSMWRSPDTAEFQEKGRLGRLELSLGTLDGNRLVLGVNLANATPTTFYKTTARAPSPA